MGASSSSFVTMQTSGSLHWAGTSSALIAPAKCQSCLKEIDVGTEVKLVDTPSNRVLAAYHSNCLPSVNKGDVINSMMETLKEKETV